MSTQLELAKLLLSLFRGRPDLVAVGTDQGTFAPQKLDKPLPPEWLALRHLSGQKCLGFYLAADDQNNVFATCADFDNKPKDPDPEWKSKVEKTYLWLQNVGLKPLAEVSQSGEAGHVWLFFDRPTPAWLARAFWAIAADGAGVVLKEVYPRQDYLTGKGVGNLVRFPLWNSGHFVDPEDWSVVEPVKALSDVVKTDGGELKGIAFGLGKELNQPPPPAQASGTSNNGTSGRDAGGDAPSSPHVSARVKSRLERQGTLLAKRWGGDTTGLKDQSDSALVQSIACELVRQYVPTPEIEGALAAWCEEKKYDKGRRQDWIARAVAKAYEFTFSRVEERSAVATEMYEDCHAYINTLADGKTAHVGSGIEALDLSIEGAAPGEMVLVGGRPGHGKSIFAVQWLDHAAGQGLPGLLVSEEMGRLQIARRVVQALSPLPEEHWSPETWARLHDDVDRHRATRARVHVVENCSSVERCEAVIDQFCGIHGVKVVAVDYLQLLRSRLATRYEQVTEISTRLKQAAARNQCVLLALCQLNREVDGRPDHEPKMSDLRDSGQLEQDADLILFLQHPHKYDHTEPKELYRILVGKRRCGRIRQARIETTINLDRQRIGPFPPVEGVL